MKNGNEGKDVFSDIQGIFGMDYIGVLSPNWISDVAINQELLKMVVKVNNCDLSLVLKLLKWI